MKEIGTVFEKSSKFEWEIENFFSSTETDPVFRSEHFSVLDSTWYIEVCTFSDESTLEYVSLYLIRYSSNASMDFQFGIGIKTVNNTVDHEMTGVKTFHENDGWGWQKFIKRSELLRKSFLLVPLGTLTITCFVKVKSTSPDLDTRRTKLVADFKDMFISKKNTDVTIKVKEETFASHRFILTARSPVLAAMFENEMTEKKTGYVNISDCDPEEFRHFLLYLYSGEMTSEKCDFFQLYKIADKYDVPELKSLCVDFIAENLSVDSFCETFFWGDQFNESVLLTRVQKFFIENSEAILVSDHWLSLVKEHSSLANYLLKKLTQTAEIKE